MDNLLEEVTALCKDAAAPDGPCFSSICSSIDALGGKAASQLLRESAALLLTTTDPEQALARAQAAADVCNSKLYEGSVLLITHLYER